MEYTQAERPGLNILHQQCTPDVPVGKSVPLAVDLVPSVELHTAMPVKCPYGAVTSHVMFAASYVYVVGATSGSRFNGE